jgi:hypothetical protein
VLHFVPDADDPPQPVAEGAAAAHARGPVVTAIVLRLQMA